MATRAHKRNGSRGYFVLALWRPKTAINVGHVLRTAFNFGAAQVLLTGQRFALSRIPTNTLQTQLCIPCTHVDDLRAAIPWDCVPVAVDLVDGAIPLPEYEHPRRAMYVFGPEDGTLGAGVTEWCRDVVSIPMAQCANLSVAAGIVAYDRVAKEARS